MISAVQAVDPLWIVPASPGLELSSVVISHDGSTIIAGGDQLIALTADGTKLWSGWSGNILAMSQDGKYIATSQGPTVRLFTREGIMLWDHSLGATVTGISFTPDAAMIVAGGGNRVQSWYNSGSGLGQNTTETVHDIKISPVKDQILVATTKALRSYNLSYVPNWYDDTISPDTVEVCADGTGIVIPNGNHIRMYHGGGKLLWDRAYPGGNIISLAYSSDGSTIVAGRDDGVVIVYDRNGNALWSRNGGVWVTSVCVSDDGSTIATGSIDNQIRIFSRQGTLLGAYTTNSPIKSRSVAISGNGSLIVAVDHSNVYGFSQSLLTVPAVTPTPEIIGNLSFGPTQGNVTTVSITPYEEINLKYYGNTSATATGITPSSDFPWFLTFLILPIAFLAQKIKSSSSVELCVE